MRKLLALAFGLALLGVAASSFAATQLSFNIGVTIRADAVDIQTDGAANNLEWGIFPINAIANPVVPGNTWTAVSPIYQVINAGGVAIDYSLVQTAPAADWTILTSGAPGDARSGAGEYRLFACFTGYLNQGVNNTTLQADDIVTGTARTADGTVGGAFAMTGEGGAGGAGSYDGGFNVVPESYAAPNQYQGMRAIQFVMDTPFSLTTYGYTHLQITVSAAAH